MDWLQSALTPALLTVLAILAVARLLGRETVLGARS
jgi:branched-subunit amino acid permease